MRRVVSALAALGVVAGLVLVPLPASAVEPPPPPVEPLKTLPSLYSKLFTGSAFIDDQIKFGAWALQQAAAENAGTATGVAVSKAVPITASVPLGAAGGAVTAGFMAGWMITDGTLAMYSNATGESPLSPSCDWGDFGSAAVQVLYPFSAPDCGVAITTPNGDQGVTYGVLTYSGYSVAYQNEIVWDGVKYWCYSTSGSRPAGTTLQAVIAEGSWQTAGLVNNGNCSPHVALIGPLVPDFPAANLYRPASAGLRLRDDGTGAILATAPVTRANPGRTAKCDLEWPDGSHTVKSSTSTYQETAGLPLSLFNATCNDAFVSKPGHGPGLLPSRIKIGSSPPGGPDTTIADNPVPDFSPSEEKGLEPGTSGGLVLQRVVGTVATSCMTWEADCADWWATSDEGTDTSEYRCLWNGSAVDLIECGVYRHTFDTRTDTPSITDPTTDLETPWLTAPESGSSPGIANSTSPAPGISPGDACFSSWPSIADPITWVMHPAYCAMLKAFVPRASVVASAQDAIGDSMSNTMIGTIGDGLYDLGESFDAGVGCGGLPFHLEGPGWEVNSMLLASCDEPAAGIAATVRTILTVAIIIGGILAFLRYLGSVFGFASFGRNNSEVGKSSGGPSFD